MQLDFLLYHRGELLRVRAYLHDDCLSEDCEDLPHITRILDGPKTWEYLDREALLAAGDAVGEICRVAAALAHRPWLDRGFVWRWPEWAQEPLDGPVSPAVALRVAASDWSDCQEARHEADHPAGPSDEATYRKEAQYGSER